MAQYTSRYSELGFYVDGSLRKFSGGQYATEDAKEIEALKGVTDALRVDEAPKQPEAKPAAKVPARKPSAK